MTRAIYPGSFDPPTLGHLDLIVRGAGMFDELVVAVGHNPEKKPLFSAEERAEMIRETLPAGSDVSVVTFDGLVVDCARREGCGVILRGIRSVSDFESEQAMAMTNRALTEGDVETIFCMPSEQHAFVSSRLIKEVFAFGGDASRFLAPAIADRVRARIESNS